MKRYRPVFIAGGLIFVFAGLVIAYTQTRDVVVTPQTVLAFSDVQKQVKVGEVFPVDVISDPRGNAIVIVEPHLTFDSTVLQVVEIKRLDSYPNVLSTEQIEAGKATITVGSSSVNTPVQKRAPAVRFMFRALQATSKTAITIDRSSFVGSLSEKAGPQNMLADSTSLSVRIVN